MFQDCTLLATSRLPYCSGRPYIPQSSAAKADLNCVAGYEDSEGAQSVAAAFDKYLDSRDLQSRRVQVDDQTVGDFLEFYLALKSGRSCPSEEEGSCHPVSCDEKHEGARPYKQSLKRSLDR